MYVFQTRWDEYVTLMHKQFGMKFWEVKWKCPITILNKATEQSIFLFSTDLEKSSIQNCTSETLKILNKKFKLFN